VLRRGLSLTVQRVALVFSNLGGSTELYAKAGDAEAFRLVQAHFATLGAAVERHGGAVVKTMSDAEMAVFPDELSAVAGARDMLVDFEALQARDALAGRSALKVGLHDGPGFVAAANRALDSFGQTVNVAARLQGEARKGQFVLAERVAHEAVDAGLLAPEQVDDAYVATTKGVGAPLRVARVQVTGRAAATRAPALQRAGDGAPRHEANPCAHEVAPLVRKGRRSHAHGETMPGAQ
jgi:adenylate cyclase